MSDKTYTIYELAKHTTSTDCWTLIDGKIYDVTKFLPEHPGGEDIMIDSAGRDSTREFEDVGHSGDARAMLTDMFIGTLREATEEEKKVGEEELKKMGKKVTGSGKSSGFGIADAMKYLLPLIIIGLAYVIRKYTT